MLRSKLFSFLNIVGLAFGLACTILLYLWIADELSFNTYHEKIDRIHLVQHWQHYGDDNFHCQVSPAPLAPAFKEKYPEVETVSRYISWAYNGLVSFDDKKISQSVAAADPDLLDIYTCNFIYGSKNDFAEGLDNIIISESVSKQYFGDIDPVGKTLMLNDEFPFLVIFLPFQFNALVGKVFGKLNSSEASSKT